MLFVAKDMHMEQSDIFYPRGEQKQDADTPPEEPTDNQERTKPPQGVTVLDQTDAADMQDAVTALAPKGVAFVVAGVSLTADDVIESPVVEQLHKYELAHQLLCALRILSPGGTLCLMLPDCFTRFTASIAHICYRYSSPLRLQCVVA